MEGAFTSRIAALEHLLLAPGSSFSLLSLGAAALAAAMFVVFARRRRGRPAQWRLVMRYVFPARILLHPSARADVFYFLFHVLVFGGAFGWAIVSQGWFSAWTSQTLTGLFGAPGAPVLPPLMGALAVTLLSFLAYEFAYWLCHWLCHVNPWLWEFHKTHHTAETLSPLTVWRVHPVEQVMFFNMLALFIGVGEGAAGYALGAGAPLTVSGANIILVGFVYLYVHLQHSHVWLPFTGVWGRVFLSPAHHQIHHSADPRHFNRNLGSCLGVWDWMFGTLYVPGGRREVTRFGVDGQRVPAHDAVGGLFDPIYATVERALGRPLVTRPAAPPPVAGDR